MTPFALFLLLLGPCAGSTAAMLAERLLRGEPVLLARSACRSCRSRLRWFELVPLLSWPLQRGACRCCGSKIPLRLWIAEVLGLGAAALALAYTPSPWEAATSALWLWCLLALALADIERFRLPNPLTTALVILGALLSLALFAPDWSAALKDAGLGALAGAGALAVINWGYRRWRGHGGLGAGDIRLMAGIGAGLGPSALAPTLLIAALCGIGFALASSWRRGKRLRRFSAIPFGAFLCAGAALVWLLQRL